MKEKMKLNDLVLYAHKKNTTGNDNQSQTINQPLLYMLNVSHTKKIKRKQREQKII